MKILCYINTLGFGGAERVMVNLAENFLAHGMEVALATSYPIEKEYSLALGVKRINLLSQKNKGNFLSRNFKLIKELRRVIKRESPDVVMSFMAEPNFRLLFACRGLGVKSIVSVRNDPNKEYPNRVYRFLAKHLYKRADTVVFQTKDAQMWFSDKIVKKSEIIMNQVDVKFYATTLDDVRSDIVTAGRLTSQKNHKMLIRAFFQIKDFVSDNLIIYGEGEMRKELEQLVLDLKLQDRVFLPGTTNDVPSVLKKSKMFVLSSDYEGMPNALIEAMAMGLPCISTDCPCGGPKSIITNDIDGVLVPVGDQEALATAILKILSDEQFASDLSLNAKQKAYECYPDKIIGRWISCVENQN